MNTDSKESPSLHQVCECGKSSTPKQIAEAHNYAILDCIEMWAETADRTLADKEAKAACVTAMLTTPINGMTLEELMREHEQALTMLGVYKDKDAELASLREIAKAAYNEHSRIKQNYDTGNVTVEDDYFNALQDALTAYERKGYKI